MNYEKEIKHLHNKGFVILRASRTTNAPIGWKRPGATKKKWGYVDEMQDPNLTVYKASFSAALLSKSHCGFYLGHGNLCCIDLDSKKSSTTIEQTTALKDAIVKKLGNKVAVETTKSNGYHIYFLYSKRLDNVPDWTGIKEAGKSNNWIELYYSKRFMACYLSNSKKYTLIHGSIADLKPLTSKQHAALLEILQPYRGSTAVAKRKGKAKQYNIDEHTWQEAENYVAQIEEQGLDITGDNSTWFKIGKAFAHAFGIKGFDMFKRLSQFSPSYNEDTIADDYERYVRDDALPRKSKISIGTFFKMCSEAGLLDLTTKNTLQLHPPAAQKEFSLELTKKERAPEHCHKVVTEFLKNVYLCCVDSQSFYLFKDTHWQKVNARYVLELINNFVDRSDIDDRYRTLLRTVPYMELMLKELRLVTQRDSIEPYTGNLDEGIYVNLENGILHIDLKNGKRKLLDHDQAYNFTTVLPYCYDPLATCERFDAWLDAQIPNKELHEAYYAFVASCLTRHKADIILMLAGPTSTGKSSLVDITRRVIGLENSTAISAGMLFSSRPEAQVQAMMMENKLLAYDFDSQPFRDLEMLLKVAAQEPLAGWQMHVARRPVTNYGRVMLAMNVYNYSVFNEAVARRFITINMDTRVEKDNSVIPAIYENELAGIFNKVLNVGVKHLIKNRGQIVVSDDVKRATMNFHMSGRDAVRWFDDNYIVLQGSKLQQGSKLDKLRKANPGVEVAFVSIADMYSAFRIWMEDVEGYPVNKIPLRKHFVQDLKIYGVEEEVYKMNGTAKRGVFVGLKTNRQIEGA